MKFAFFSARFFINFVRLLNTKLMKTLTEKVILVTGASRGIGAAVAQRLAEAGAKVIINYVGGKEAADDTVERIKQQGGIAFAIQADVSKSAEVKNLFDKAIEQFGRIDVLINNAGVMITKPLKDTTDEDFTKQFDINVRGTFNTMREAATKLAENGSIINFSSSVNRPMLPGYSTYAATKAAVEQLSRVE
jgi:3-oxoacyl-[acyl-carrier protein] reductase